MQSLSFSSIVPLTIWAFTFDWPLLDPAPSLGSNFLLGTGDALVPPHAEHDHKGLGSSVAKPGYGPGEDSVCIHVSQDVVAFMMLWTALLLASGSVMSGARDVGCMC